MVGTHRVACHAEMKCAPRPGSGSVAPDHIVCRNWIPPTALPRRPWSTLVGHADGYDAKRQYVANGVMRYRDDALQMVGHLDGSKRIVDLALIGLLHLCALFLTILAQEQDGGERSDHHPAPRQVRRGHQIRELGRGAFRDQRIIVISAVPLPS